jgi:amino acid permease
VVSTPPLTGLIYIFNLIIGTEALTLPAAFHDVWWLLSSVIIIMLAFMSYLTDTFGIESMAAANGSLEEAAKTEKVWRICE